MFTHQARNRYFKVSPGAVLTFPNTVRALFIFQPLQPFGKASGGGRTAMRSVAAEIVFNKNTGHHSIESKEPLRPLEVVVEEPEELMELNGNELSLSGIFDTPDQLEQVLYSVYLGFPILLNVEFADPVVVERVEGQIGDVPFRWELIDWNTGEFLLTTQDEQEEKAISSWSRFGIITEPGNRRLLAALHYFHVFCRLCRTGHTPWEFMPEAITNLSKILEVLFPKSGSEGTIDAARAGLKGLGYQDADIERSFIPALALRNGIDGAHVDLAIFTTSELRVLHAYTEAAEASFRKLLSRMLKEIEAGNYKVVQHSGDCRHKKALDIVARMEQYYGDKISQMK